MEDRTSKIRKALKKAHRPYPNSPYPKEVREEAASLIVERRWAGEPWGRIADELGISVNAARWWHGRARRSRRLRGSSLLLPVRLKDVGERMETGQRGAGELVLTTPGGYRIEGLDVAGALQLLEVMR